MEMVIVIVILLIAWILFKVLKNVFLFLAVVFVGSTCKSTTNRNKIKKPVILSDNNKPKYYISSEESNSGLLNKENEDVTEEKTILVHESSSISCLDNINPLKVIDMLEAVINKDVKSSWQALKYDFPNEIGVTIYTDFDKERRQFMVAPYWEHLPTGRTTLGLRFTNVESFWLEGDNDEEMKSLYYSVKEYLYKKSSLNIAFLSPDYPDKANEIYNRQIISIYELHWDPSIHGDCCDEYNLEKIVLHSLTKIRFEYLRAVNYAKHKTEIYHW